MRRVSPRFTLTLCIIIGFNFTPSTELLAQPRKRAAHNGPGMQAYLSGNGFLNRGLYDLAAAEYRKFLAAYPDHEKATPARYGLSVCLFRTRNYKEAGDLLSELHRLDSFQFAAEVGTMLGQCNLARGRHAAAAKAFASVVRDHEDHPLADDAAAQLIEALYGQGKVKAADAQCQAFVKRWHNSPHRDRAAYFGGLAAMTQRAYDVAAGRFEYIRKTRPDSPFANHVTLLLAQCHHHRNAVVEAAKLYEQVLKQAKSIYRSDALLGLGGLLRRGKKLEESGRLLDELLESHPKSPHAVQARFLRGRVWFDAGNYEQAGRAFEQVKAVEDPPSPDTAYWSAKCDLRLNRFKAASRKMKQAIEQHPECRLLPEMRYDLAIAYLGREDLPSAVESLLAFREAHEAHPLAPAAQELLASTFHQMGQYADSLRHTRAFLKRYPDHKLTANLAFLEAENNYLLGEFKSAAKQFDRFLERHTDHPKRDTARYRLGMAYYRLDNLDNAVRILKELKISEKRGAAFSAGILALGDIHFRREEWKEAEKHLAAYLSGGKDLAGADDALLKLGLCLQRQNSLEAALENYDLLLARFAESPHRVQATFERGQALVSLKRHAEAAEAFERVLAEEGQTRFDVHARQHLAAISVHAGDYKEAARRYSKVARASKGTESEAGATFHQARALMTAGEFKSAERALRRLIERFPDHEVTNRATANLAIVQARRDKHADALETIQRVNPRKLDQQLRDALTYEKAWCLRETGKADKAVEAWAALLGDSVEPRLRIHARLEIAAIEAEAGRDQKAAEHLVQLQKLLEQHAGVASESVGEQAAYRLGAALFRLKKHDEAAKVLAAFVKRYPKSEMLMSAAYFCGESQFARENHERAAAQFERIVKNGKSEPVLGPSLLRLGECRSKLQQWSQSEQAFNAHRGQFAESEQWYQAEFGLGWALENQGRFDDAIEAYARVIAKHKGPTSARAQFQIGQCRFGQKRYEDAVRELLKVDILYAYPEWNAAALYEAGRCFQKLAKAAEARQQFETVVNRYAGTPWADLAAKQLAAPAKVALPGRG